MSEFKMYRKKNVQPMRPYIPGEDLTGISVNKEDTPELGGMIAVNPSNTEDRWYVARKFFMDNYEPGDLLGRAMTAPKDEITKCIKDNGLCGVGGFCDDCPATNETRHQTAKRYIKNAERGRNTAISTGEGSGDVQVIKEGD